MDIPEPLTNGKNGATFTIPTIDLSPYLTDPSSASSKDLISRVRTACLTTGFFQITNHGIPSSLQARVFKASEALFKLPMEEKKKLDKSASVGASNRGYEVLGNQALQEDSLPDLKEGFYVGKEIPADDPRVVRKAFLMGPNLWPNPALIPEEVFRRPLEEYYDRIFALSLKVLDVVIKGLGFGDGYEDGVNGGVFKEFVSNDAVASVRLLHYPPDESGDERQLGAGAHTDFGAITLLLQDKVGGLQVWDYKDEIWRDVEPNPDAYVVNVGDMLQMWTAGTYKSSLHRVINRSGSERYSVPFFFDGNVDTILRPLDGSSVKGGGKALSVEEHMRERFQTSYGRGKKRSDGGVDVNV